MIFRFIEVCMNGAFRAWEWAANAYLRCAEACMHAWYRTLEVVARPFHALAHGLWHSRSLRYKRGVNGLGWSLLAFINAAMLIVFNSPNSADAESQLMLTNVLMALCIIACAALAWMFDKDLRKKASDQLKNDLFSARLR